MDTDLELIERVRNGDTNAFKELVTKHKRNVYYLAFDITRNREDAEDVTQDVFIKAFRSIKNFRGDAKFSSWLYRITVNTCLTLKTRKSYTVMKASDNIEDTIDTDFEIKSSGRTDPVDNAEAEFIRKNIEKALNKLTEKERTVFIMRNYSEMHFNEIVEIMNLKPGTVRSLNFKALKKLRKELAFYKEEI